MTATSVHSTRRLLVVALGVLPLLGGCKLLSATFSKETCHEPQVYETAQEAPLLQVPAGLDVPSARGALKVPPLDTPARKLSASEPCLDHAPTYYPGRPRPGQQSTKQPKS